MKLPVLADVRVATPCRADWRRMTGTDRVRHCGECEQRVYDLSELTRAEAEALIVATEGRMCVRFYERADGTLILRDCEVPRPNLVARGAAAMVLAGALGCGARQPAPVSHPPERQHVVIREPMRMGVMTLEPEPRDYPPVTPSTPATPPATPITPTPLTHALDPFLEQPKR